ncbi:MAG: hypothetical protein JSW03_08720 [Candidatus Eiseniibacteriota bacterium]|nr:MAG: hypothetical protein JSW03_08720 [Candidatus Eisenbacteria bacterium]
MAQNVSRFGFRIPQDGDMLYGRDLRNFITQLSTWLTEAVYEDHVQQNGYVTAVTFASLTTSWQNTVALLDEGGEFIFSKAADIDKLRVIGLNSTLDGDVEVSLGLAGTIIPLTGTAIVNAAGGDSVVSALTVPTTIDADEELVLLARLPAAGAATTGQVDLQVSLDMDIRKTGE